MTVVKTVKNANGTVQAIENIYLDVFDRTLVRSNLLPDGTFNRVDTQYDSFGRIQQTSAPCSFTSCSYYWTTFTYDLLGRVTASQRPVSATNGSLQTTSYQYRGRTTVITDPQGKNSTKVMTVVGKLGRSQDHDGYYQSFDYDAFGSLLSVTDELGNTLFGATYVYGIRALQTTFTDADLGSRSNTYDALGELLSYTDAKGQNFSMSWDSLARPTSRTEPDLTTTLTYGTSSASRNIGKIQSVSAQSGAGTYSEAYSYDAYGRLGEQVISIPSDASYTYDYSYNAVTGLLDTLTYPTSTSSYRLKLQYTYQYGALQSISDFNAPGTVFYTANAYNARDQVTQETLGNGVVTNQSFDAVTGWLNATQSGAAGGTTLQNDSYLYDLVGNVIQRQNNNTGISEDFYYDDVYRLDHSTLNGVLNLQMTYDPTGNITSRSDVGAGTVWTYDANRKHAVLQTGSGGHSYTYDANGNVSSRDGQAISWASFNHPLSISGVNGEAIAFSYNMNHQRWRSIYTGSAGTETTYFAGAGLEKVITAGNVNYRYLISTGSETVAIYSRMTSGANTLRYVREDHQGGVSALLSNDGTAYVKESFTAFGSRRGSCTWSGPPTSGELTLISNVTRHGYTWQDALGTMGLNDMNGRIQDAVSGRFLSPDPTIPNPGMTQSFNRYSYVNNNPLTFSDPTGFEPAYRCISDCGISSSSTDSNPDPGGAETISYSVPIPIAQPIDFTGATSEFSSESAMSGTGTGSPGSEVTVTGSNSSGNAAFGNTASLGASFDGSATNSGGSGGADRMSEVTVAATTPRAPSVSALGYQQLASNQPTSEVVVSATRALPNSWIPYDPLYAVAPYLSVYPGGPLAWQPGVSWICYATARMNNSDLHGNMGGGAFLGVLGGIGAGLLISNIVGFPEVEIAEVPVTAYTLLRASQLGGVARLEGIFVQAASVDNVTAPMSIMLRTGMAGGMAGGALAFGLTPPTCAGAN